MTKQSITKFLLTILISIMGEHTFAYDIEVMNIDGITIYYNYINDGKELEVTYKDYYKYEGNVVIPEEVIYMNRTRKVTSIGEGAFSCNYALYRFVSLIEEPFEMESIVDEGTYRIAKLYVPAGTVDKYKNTIGWSDFEEIIENKIITLQNADGVAINYEFNFDGTELMVVNGAYSGDVNIPEEVTIDGKKQQVDVISEKAFFSCAALTSVTIPNTVNYIGYNAFYGCSGLSTITLPSSVSAIGDGAFYGIDFQSVVSLIEHPSEIYGYDDEEFTSTFSENTFNNATLYVPAGTIDRYMATEGWKKFQNIVELDPAAINAVAKKPENSAIYDLNGMRLTQPQKGINIIGGKKVIIK